MEIPVDRVLTAYQLEIGALTQRALLAEVRAEQLASQVAEVQRQLANATEPPADLPLGDA